MVVRCEVECMCVQVFLDCPFCAVLVYCVCALFILFGVFCFVLLMCGCVVELFGW